MAQFEALLNQAPIGVYLVDFDFRIRHVNPAAEGTFRDIPGGVVGRDFDEIIHMLWQKDFADELVEIFRDTLSTGEPYLARESAAQRAGTGEVEYYEWSLYRILLSEGRYGLVCYFRDIGERKRAEQVANRLAAIVESSEDAIVSKTLDGIIRSWNRGAQRLYNYTADEAIGQSIAIIVPPDRLDEESAILERLKQGERVEPFETIRRRKDGTGLNISLTVSPLRDLRGRSRGSFQNRAGYNGQSPSGTSSPGRQCRPSTRQRRSAAICPLRFARPARTPTLRCDLLSTAAENIFRDAWPGRPTIFRLRRRRSTANGRSAEES